MKPWVHTNTSNYRPTGFFSSFPTFCFSMETSTVSDLAFIIFNAFTYLLNPSLSHHSLSYVASPVSVLLALTCELPCWTPVEVCILGMTTALARKNTLDKFLLLFPAQPWWRYHQMPSWIPGSGPGNLPIEIQTLTMGRRTNIDCTKQSVRQSLRQGPVWE